MGKIAFQKTLSAKTQTVLLSGMTGEISSQFKKLGSALLTIFKSSCLIVVLGFSLQPAFSGNNGESDEEGSQTLEVIIEQCEKSVKRADQETLGMDMASYAAMAQVTNQAVSVGSRSAKIAQQGNAAINTVMAGNAMKRCTKCKSAISQCKSSCDLEENCQQFQSENYSCDRNSPPNYGCTTPPTPSDPCLSHRVECEDSFKECDRSLDKNKEECAGFSTPCEQACLQAGLSGLTALTSLMAANQLGNCEGGDCKTLPKKGPEEPEELKLDPKNPNSPSAPGSSGLTEFASSDGSVSGSPYQLSGKESLSGSKTKTNNKIAGKDGGGHYFGRDGLSNRNGNSLDPLSSSPSSSGSMAGGVPSSNHQASLGNLGRDKKDPYKKFKDRNGEEDMDLAQAGFSPGGSLTGYKTSGANSGSHYGRRSGKSSKESKRGVSGEADSQAEGSDQNFKDTIFVRTSRLIVHFCDNSRC